MRFLIYLFLTLFISQMVINNIQINDDNLISCDIQKEKEDGSEKEKEEKEDSKKEYDEEEEEKNNTLKLRSIINCQNELLQSYFKQKPYASVYIEAPFTPPDMSC